MTKNIRHEVVEEYATWLSLTYKHKIDAFPAVFETMKVDKRVRQQEAHAILKRFRGLGTKSDPKWKSFQLILDRYNNIMDTKARMEATAGRTAA